MKEKTKKAVKARIKDKLAKTKEKVKSKLKGAATTGTAIGIMLLMVGCSNAQPASRATTASYEIGVSVCMDENVKSVTVNMPFTFGDGALASADSEGSTETQTATPTLDVKPDVNVNYAQGGGITNRGTGGAKAAGAAGIIESLTAEGLSALKAALANNTTGKVTLQKKDGTTTTAECKDGTCTFEDGMTVTAEDCANCKEAAK